MALQAVAGQPGHWRNPGHAAGTPGLFAVVIGVSDYPHLDGGRGKRAADTFDLGQLSVSALTAQRFFDWLARRYALPGCPLAEAWCLLAPTAAELAHEAALALNPLAPTLDHCEQSLFAWQAALKALPLGAARDSRALFFFSGHGLEVHQGQQILLPCDYLNPAAPGVNRALSTQNLVRGLADLAVPTQLYFIDACRNDNQRLRDQRLEGRLIFDEQVAARSNPDVIAPILYATASGQQAFQQPEPQRGLSLYGQALLDGLVGTPDIELRANGDAWAVDLYPLQAFVKSRIVRSLQEARETLRQPLKLGGTSDNEPIALVPGAPPQRRRLSGTDNAQRLAQALVAPLTVDRRLAEAEQASLHGDFGAGHDLWGSEQITGMWQGARLYTLGDNQSVPLQALHLQRVRHSPDRRSFRVVLDVTDEHPRGHLLEWHFGGEPLAIVLPAHRGRRCEIEFAFEIDSHQQRRLLHVEAALARDDRRTDVVAELWQAMAVADPATAMQQVDKPTWRAHVRGAFNASELNAAIIGLVALAGWKHVLLHELLNTMAEPVRMADPAVIVAELALREQRPELVQDVAAGWLLKLEHLGLPMLAPALAQAANRVSLLAMLDCGLDRDARQRLAALQERLATALTWLRSDGLFAVYRGYRDTEQVLSLYGASTGELLTAHV